MRCPHCGSVARSEVLETRRGPDAGIVRRRKCPSCSGYFRTVEQVAGVNIRVRKSDGRLVPFVRDKVRRAIVKAAVRPRQLSRLDDVVDGVLADAVRLADSEGVVESTRLGDSTLEQLRQLDPVSFVRYALVQVGRLDHIQPGWRDVGDFRQWLARHFPDMRNFRPPVDLSEVVKKDNSREPFDLVKLERSIGLASKGRGADDQAVRRFAAQVGGEVRRVLNDQPLVTSGQIAAEILQALRKRDHIAFLRYASAAKDYKSVSDYETEAVALRNM